jgi:uncharacterized repeat protein (TIGR01451 family)
MKRKTAFIVLVAAVLFLPVYLSATITSITGLTMTPPLPTVAGTNVSVNWTYTTDTNNDNPFCLILISDTNTVVRDAGTAGQWIMMANGCPATYGTPHGPAGSGCPVPPGNVMAGTYTTGAFTFNLPADLVPGVPYYIIVCMGTYWCQLNPTAAGGNVQSFSTTVVPFVLDLPPGSATISKTVESTEVKPGDLVLYTINYDVINSDTFTITDTVPANCTLISQSSAGNGTSSGTTPGSTLSWPVGNISTAKTGVVWFIVQVDNTAPAGTVSNTSSWTATDHNSPYGALSGSSNTASFNIGLPFSLIKSQNPASPGTANSGDTVTYTLDFHAGGRSFAAYSDFFDNPITGFLTPNGGTWLHQTDATAGEYLYSPIQSGYPHYLRNTPSDFCFGEISGDIWISNQGNWDGLISFRDDGLPGGCAYGVGISKDGYDGSIAHSFWIQKYCGPTGGYPGWAAAAPAINPETWYSVKILVTDAGNGQMRVQGKVWVRGTAEPGTWALDWTDISGAVYSCGYVGFQGHPTNQNYYDNLKIIKSTQSYPVIFDSVPSTLTYQDGTPADSTHAGPVVSGGIVSWSIITSLTDVVYSLQWTGLVTSCGDAYNTASFDTREALPIIDSNTTTLNMTCNSPTITETWTESQTPVPSNTASPTFTGTSTFTPTSTMTATPTITPTTAYPLMQLTKSASPNPVLAGELVTYTINYRNASAVAPATGFRITDNLNNYLEWVSGGTHSGGVLRDGILYGGDLTFNIGNVPANSGWLNVSFIARTDSLTPKGSFIANTAHSTTNENGAADSASNEHQLSVFVPDLKLTPVVSVPNPAVDHTEIIFNLTVAAQVTLKFYTISGELIRTMDPSEVIVNLQGQSSVRAGNNRVEWDCKNKSGQQVSSGIYFYRVQAETAVGEKAFYISKLAVLR